MTFWILSDNFFDFVEDSDDDLFGKTFGGAENAYRIVGIGKFIIIFLCIRGRVHSLALASEISRKVCVVAF